jgi:hypothetical protein
MASLILSGSTSGSVTLSSPAVSGTTTLTLPTTTSTLAINGPAFSAYAGSGQSISSGTFTKVTCGTEEWDTNSNYDNTTNYRFTPTVAGYYQVNGYVGFTSSTRTNTLVVIYKNGSAYRTLNQLDSNLYVVGGSSIVYLNGSTDYIELYVYSAASGTTATGTDKTIFSTAMIRGA